MLSIAAALTLAASLTSVAAQQTTPSVLNSANLRFVDTQYANSGYGLPAFAHSTSTGFDLTSTELLAVSYGARVIQNGNAYAASDVAAMPTVFITPPAAVTSDVHYSLMLIDISAINNPDPQGVYRHYLAHGVHAASSQTASAANLTFTPVFDRVLTQYAGPGPAAGSGKHRYAWLLFKTPSNFNLQAAADPANAPGHWDPAAYCAQINCGTLVASTFFTVENAAPTFATVATTAANTAAVSVAASSAVAGASSRAAGTSGAARTTASGIQASGASSAYTGSTLSGGVAIAAAATGNQKTGAGFKASAPQTLCGMILLVALCAAVI